MYLTENLQKKWAPVLDHPDLPKIQDNYRRAVTALILENQESSLRQESNILNEAAPTNNYGGGNIGAFDPILISLVRRTLPNLMAYDVCGVQPMTGPTGLIFAMKSRYTSQTGNEALFLEADTDFSGQNPASPNTGHSGTAHAGLSPFDATFTTGAGLTTAQAEALGTSSSPAFNEMAFSIDKVTVSAKTRALKAEYTMEIAQDLKAVHGLDAEGELANILSNEILAEINREIIRTLYYIARVGAQAGTATAGTFDLDVDSNGRWSVEKFKGLLFQVEREANAIAKDTRRGKGNFIICSSDVASALAMAGVLDYAPAMKSDLTVDDTGNTFAGILNGRYKVYVDPYFISGPATAAGGVQGTTPATTSELLMVGYKGSSPYDAGFFYCPYVPLQMVRAVDPNSFQPKIAFKTRYGVAPNPFFNAAYANNAAPFASAAAIVAASNGYYRLVKVNNLL